MRVRVAVYGAMVSTAVFVGAVLAAQRGLTYVAAFSAFTFTVVGLWQGWRTIE